jgi:hypothetical protein
VKGSRAEWIVLAALVVVTAAVAALAGDPHAADPETVPDPSTYNPRGSGTMALYVWLQELGLPVRRWERPSTELPARATLLLVLGPRIPLEGAELHALEEWVRGGGILLLADDQVGRPVPGVLAGAPVLSFGLEPHIGERPQALTPAFPSPYAAGVQTIEPTGRVRFQRQRPEGWAPLFGDRAGDVLAIRRSGKGAVLALSDPALFSNARLEVAGHARLILNIAQAHAASGEVLVDEFHHGHGHRGSLLRYFTATAAPWMLGQAALAVLALVLARGTRFGPPVPAGDPERASSLEYVGALGDLYRRARARRLAGRTLARSLRTTLTRALGAQPGEEVVGLAARAARRLGVPAERVRACLEPGPAAMASDEELVKLAQAVHRIETRLLAEERCRNS